MAGYRESVATNRLHSEPNLTERLYEEEKRRTNALLFRFFSKLAMKTCRSTRSYLVTLWAVLFVSCGPTVAQSVAVFDFELIDTSLEGAIRGTRLDEQERLARLSDQLRQLLRASGRFSLVDITPIASEAQASNLQACGGCDIQLARRIGAELAITGTVQKVSNLILNMNIYVRDASSGATIAAMSADMRGNTDETWSRTLDWLVRNRLLAPGYGLQR